MGRRGGRGRWEEGGEGKEGGEGEGEEGGEGEERGEEEGGGAGELSINTRGREKYPMNSL